MSKRKKKGKERKINHLHINNPSLKAGMTSKTKEKSELT
jgi:hypothetical protein